jgi:nicotinamide-nucleotide amidase
VRGEIVSVGTELLLGMIADTNAQYLCQELATIGVDVFWISQVGDNLGRVKEVFQRGLDRSEVVIVTGGLGPTEDDLTREAIGAALGESLTVDPELERQLRDNFARRNRPMPERNIKQATLIPSARSLPNPLGTAPGWWVEHNGSVIVAMPGVPAEMRLMWDQQAKPPLRERSGAGILVTTTLRVIGLGEGAVEEELGDLIHGTNPTVATYAKPDGVQVRVSAKGPDGATANRLLAPTVKEVEGILGKWIYGRDDETLAKVSGSVLQERGWSLASAEHGTAGALANEIASDDGFMASYRGGFMVGETGAPLEVAPSDPRQLATAARQRAGADVGVATILSQVEGRLLGEYAVDLRGSVLTGDSRWNMGIPELRRRAAVETLALLVRALREES